MASSDAFLLVSFGGPEGPADVMPFLENVLRGRNVPPERMRAVAAHYELFSGVSPINGQNRALLRALGTEFEAHGLSLPLYWGNRNWQPLLADTLRQMADDGVTRALAFVTSAFSSYSGCRQYLEDIERARAAVGERAPRVEKLRASYNHPDFVAVMIDRVHAAFATIPADRRAAARLAFTAHSIPRAMADGCAYVAQLEEAAGLIAAGAGRDAWRLVFQSRSGPPSQPWLEPDVLDHLRAVKAEGAADVVLVPLGFLSDHMEVKYDLDHEAQQEAAALGLNLVRAGTAAGHPGFAPLVRKLLEERLGSGADRPTVGSRGPLPDVCPADCCPGGTGGHGQGRP